MAANEHRGEVAITLVGEDYVMRPTFQCLCEIEAQTGVGIFAMARRFHASNFGISDAAIIVTAGMKAAGETGATVKKIGEMIFETGLDKTAAPITEFLMMALGGPSQGNAETADES